jgi:hypothetical protein
MGQAAEGRPVVFAGDAGEKLRQRRERAKLHAAWRRQNEPAKVRAEKQAHYLRNRESISARRKERYRLNADSKRGRVAAQYGLALAEYSAMLEKRGGLCDICGKPQEWRRGDKEILSLCLDHDHATGQNRGMLCSRCNRAIGLLGDDPALLGKAEEYLRRWGK